MRALILLIMLWPGLALAQQTCLPSDVFPNGTGTPYVLYQTGKVTGRLGWCKDGAPRQNAASPTGWDQGWRIGIFTWCVQSRCASLVDALKIMDTIRAAPAGAAQAAAVAAAASAVSIALVPGSQDEFDFKVWWSRACRHMTTAPYPVEPPTKFTAGWTFPANYCAPEPTVAPAAYVVGLATRADGTRPSYPYKDGIRDPVSNGRAVSGQVCGPPLLPATGGFWATFGPPFDPVRVALCVPAPTAKP